MVQPREGVKKIAFRSSRLIHRSHPTICLRSATREKNTAIPKPAFIAFANAPTSGDRRLEGVSIFSRIAPTTSLN